MTNNLSTPRKDSVLMEENHTAQPQSKRKWTTPVGLAVLAMTLMGSDRAFAAAPTNDDIANATIVTEPLPFNAAESTVEATTAGDDQDCSGNGPTVWFAYTPGASGWIQANTFGSNYDTTLSAYTGTPGSLTGIACNDDSVGVQSRVRIEVTAGVSYWFMVGAYASGSGGNLVFNVDVTSPPPVVNLTVSGPVSVDPKTGTATVTVHVQASAPVFVYDVSAYLVQPTGRGNVIASGGGYVFESVDSYDAVLTLKDSLSLSTKGNGFVGGPARLQANLAYNDGSGIQFLPFDEAVTLKPGTR